MIEWREASDWPSTSAAPRPLLPMMPTLRARGAGLTID
jgi:hypothetical protein